MGFVPPEFRDFGIAEYPKLKGSARIVRVQAQGEEETPRAGEILGREDEAPGWEKGVLRRFQEHIPSLSSRKTTQGARLEQHRVPSPCGIGESTGKPPQKSHSCKNPGGIPQQSGAAAGPGVPSHPKNRELELPTGSASPKMNPPAPPAPAHGAAREKLLR